MVLRVAEVRQLCVAMSQRIFGFACDSVPRSDELRRALADEAVIRSQNEYFNGLRSRWWTIHFRSGFRLSRVRWPGLQAMVFRRDTHSEMVQALKLVIGQP